MPKLKATLAEYMAQRSRVEPNGCTRWTGLIARTGYGYVTLGKRAYAHRIAYELHYGPIPDGLVLDHLCRNRWCVNPEHLDVVTHRENIIRGTGAAARNARKTHCKHGHEFTPENTHLYGSGWRKCKTCLLRVQEEAKTKRKRGAMNRAQESGILPMSI